MARISSSAKPLTYAVSYGFLGGPGTSRKLRKMLQRQGLVKVSDIQQADIIIAHSAGCWLVPGQAKPKLIVFVGMTLNQSRLNKTFKRAQRENIKAFIRNTHLLRGSSIGFYSLWYGLVQPKRNNAIIQAAKQYPTAPEFPNAQTVFIANQRDPWSRPAHLEQYIKARGWAFIGMSGSHNDIWEYPDHYAAIINHYARLLA